MRKRTTLVPALILGLSVMVFAGIPAFAMPLSVKSLGVRSKHTDGEPRLILVHGRHCKRKRGWTWRGYVRHSHKKDCLRLERLRRARERARYRDRYRDDYYYEDYFDDYADYYDPYADARYYGDWYYDEDGYYHYRPKRRRQGGR